MKQAGSRWRRWVVGGLALLVAWGAAGARAERETGEDAMVYPGESWETAAPAAQGFDPAIFARAVEAFAEAYPQDGNAALLIVRNGRVVWEGARAGDRFAVFSCTKSFLGTVLGLLWDDGRCTPETRAAAIMPELAARYPDITLAHLSTFTSGYQHRERQALDMVEPRYAPGTAMRYGRESDLLAAILTRLAGEPIRDLFMRRIGEPIGLTDASFAWGLLDLPDAEIPVHGGAGHPPTAVQITARGMARFGWLFLRRGRWNGRQLISERYIDAATVVRVPPTVPPHDPDGWYKVLPGRYGLNWWVNGVDAQGHRFWPNAPETAFAAQGNRNNICIILPEWNMVVVRLGADPALPVERFDTPLRRLREALEAGGGLPAEGGER